MQTVTDLGKFPRREVNALLLDLRTLMLGVSALLLAVSALAYGRELARHLLDGPSELCELAGDRRYVLSGCHVEVDRVYANPTVPQDRGYVGLSALALAVEAAEAVSTFLSDCDPWP